MTISWSGVRSIQAVDVAEHFSRARSLGLDCPLDVFEQLFHDHHGDADFAAAVGVIDWANVLWEEMTLSGAMLRRVAVPRPYQHAVNEARWRTLEEGIRDERAAVTEHWRVAGTWLRAPILVAGEVIGSPLGSECLVGFTRLGNLLGLLDRQQIREAAVHRVWVGQRQFARHVAPKW